MLQVGEVIGGRFRVDRLIGVGGFGVVAAATHLELRQSVAIKMMKDEFVGDTEIIERFLREARAVAVLRTDHVCRVLDVARTENGTPYIVMDLLEGSDVASMLRAGPVPVGTAVDFVVQACVALAEAHPLGIVHRDLKPPNLFVTRRADGAPLVKLLDFGVAKAADELRLTHSMAMLGSPQFMSPEQLTTPRDVDSRTDIWSLGVTLYQMISGRLPFPSAQIGELAVMITSQAPAPIDVVPGLRAVLMRCLEKERSARFADVAALATALAPFGAPTTQTYAALVRTTSGSLAVPMATSSTGAPKRNRALLFAPLAVLLVGGALAGSFFLMSGSSKQTPSKTVETKPVETKPVETKPVETKPVVVEAKPVIEAKPAVIEAKPVVETKPVEVKPIKSRPAESADVPHQTDPVLVEVAKGLAGTEKQIKDYANDPALLQRLYPGAVGMACALKDVGKARKYLAKITDEEKQKELRGTCAAYGISL